MPGNKDPSWKFEALRLQAEKLLSQEPEAVVQGRSDIAELLHELSIHQTELEIQNEELKLAQQELSRLHRQYEDLYEHAPCGYLTLNDQGIISQANLTAVSILEASKQTLCRSSFSSFIDRDWAASYLEARQKALASAEKQSIELPLRGERGLHRWIRADIAAESAEAGSMAQWRIVLLDISERKRTEDRLTEARLEALLQLSQMHQASLGDITDQALQESALLTGSKMALFAFLTENGQPETWRIFIRESDGSGSFPEIPSIPDFLGSGLWQEISQAGEPLMVNEPALFRTMELSSSERRPALDRFLAIPLLEGDRRGAVALLANKVSEYDDKDVRQLRLLMEALWQIARRKLAEQALSASEERYRTIFSSSPVGIFHATLDWRFVEINPSLAEMLGYQSPEEALREVGQVDNLLDIRAEGGFEACPEQAAATDIIHHLRRFQQKNGGEFIANVYVKTVRDAEGRPFFLEGIVEDVTERQRAEREKEELQAQLLQAQKIETIGRLAGGVAHEFNNLLQGMLGNIQLLQMRTVDSTVSPYLDRLSSSIYKSKEIVNTLLTISRKKTLQLQAVQLNSVVRETMEFVSRALPKHVTLILRISEDLPLIKADPTQISQVLINLVRNGCDAIPAGSQGTVEIATAVSAEPWPGAEGQEQAQPVLLTVTDSGLGMPEEIQEHIFEPFFTTKDPGQGTGLGLASVYSIVDSHSGVISFSSQTGQGTTFRILLPAATPKTISGQPIQSSGLAAPSQ